MSWMAFLNTGVLLLFVLLIVVVTRWTDRKGWTRFRGGGRRSVAAPFAVWHGALSPGVKSAIEWRQEIHAEENADGEGDDPDPTAGSQTPHEPHVH